MKRILFAMLLFLLLLGCRSTHLQRHTQIDIDSMRMHESMNKILSDSTWWNRLHLNFKQEAVKERYVPVTDSTGAVIGAVLDSRETVTTSSTSSSDIGGSTSKREEEQVKSSESGKTQLSDEIDKTVKAPSPFNWSFSVLIIICVLVLLYYFYRKCKV